MTPSETMRYPHPGNSYGFEYHFRWNTEGTRVVVFNYVDGCIYGIFKFNDYPNHNAAKVLAEHDARKLCQKLNGNPEVNVGGIDSTP